MSERSKKNMLTISVTKMMPFLKTRGIDTKAVLMISGVSPEILNSPDHRLGTLEVDRIIRTIVEITHNEDIGLFAGAGLSKGFSSILGYILMNCVTLEAAIEKYCRYEKIVDQSSSTSLQFQGSEAMLFSATLESPLFNNRQFSDYKIAGIHAYARILSGERLFLKKVCFTYPKPENTLEYERIFQCPVYFGGFANCLVFDRSFLKLPLIEPNPELLSFFESKAREIMAGFSASETYTQKVIQVMVGEMRGELPPLEKVAQELKISARSLQIHLKKEGTSFSQIVLNIRRDMAIQYLKSSNISMDEIAYILGFSEPSAFHRAFKKWTLQTPGQYRRGSQREGDTFHV